MIQADLNSFFIQPQKMLDRVTSSRKNQRKHLNTIGDLTNEYEPILKLDRCW